MAKLSREQIKTLLVNAGFKKDSQTTNDMIAIAYAESGGDPSKHNGNASTGDDSYGLWQINMIGSMGPSRRKQFGITSNTQLLDPATNAKAAYIVYKSQGLNAWSTYKRGDYLRFMDTTTTEEGGNKNPVATAQDKLNDLANIPGAISKVGDDLFKTGTNVAAVMIAISLVALGAVFLLRNVIPVGKGLKIAKKVVS